MKDLQTILDELKAITAQTNNRQRLADSCMKLALTVMGLGADTVTQYHVVQIKREFDRVRRG